MVVAKMAVTWSGESSRDVYHVNLNSLAPGQPGWMVQSTRWTNEQNPIGRTGMYSGIEADTVTAIQSEAISPKMKKSVLNQTMNTCS